jgi:hypothetical protein
MIEIEVELNYFLKDAERYKGIELNRAKINEICAKVGLEPKFKDKSKSPGGFPMLSISFYSAYESELKSAVKEILALYGKPELPMGFLLGPEKKRGNELVKSVMKELSL